MKNKQMTMKDCANLVNGKSNLLFSLYERWQDEKEYEDFAEYKLVLVNAFTKEEINIKKVTQRPLGMVIECLDGVLTTSIKRQGNYIKIFFKSTSNKKQSQNNDTINEKYSQSEFEKLCSKFAFNKNDYMREFTIQNKTLQICGFKPRNTKMPIIAIEKGTNKTYKLAVETVIRNLLKDKMKGVC